MSESTATRIEPALELLRSVISFSYGDKLESIEIKQVQLTKPDGGATGRIGRYDITATIHVDEISKKLMTASIVIDGDTAELAALKIED